MRTEFIDPWSYGLEYGIHQAVLIENSQRTLYCSGQAAVDGEGTPQAAGDMGGQIDLALDNIVELLEGAGMNLGSVVRLNIYTTDLDAFFQSHHRLKTRLAAANVSPPGTLIEVKRLAAPGVMVEMEATAAD